MWPYPEHWDVDTIQSHTLAALMEMGETNYLRLRRLIPDLDHLPPRSVSRVDGCLDLHLEILDRWRYTTNLVLTYQFPGDSGSRAEPDLNLRLYHDARAAEAVSGILQRTGPLAQLDPRYTLHQKWMLNRFLYKWLGYCLWRGHCFGASGQSHNPRKPLAISLST